MHAEARRWMDYMLQGLPYGGGTILDVGSRDINGSYRELVERIGYKYIGLDIEFGQNVDIVLTDPYRYPFEDNTLDAAICGNSLHNIISPNLTIEEMARVIKPGGLLAIVTVWKLGLNEYPKDYWRFLPDGLRYLFDRTNCLGRYEIKMVNDQDIIAMAIKR
jgi:SAM-dependent methyltransferase